jgi:hypothetical protein
MYAITHEKDKKEGADDRQPHVFDNPKTNLTYEKNLYILLNKFRAKSITNISLMFRRTKYFNLNT